MMNTIGQFFLYLKEAAYLDTSQAISSKCWRIFCVRHTMSRYEARSNELDKACL